MGHRDDPETGLATVPPLVGLAAIQAHDIALDAQLLAVDQDPSHSPTVAGVVAAQAPNPGTQVQPGDRVLIWVRTTPDEGGGGGGGQRIPTGPKPKTPAGVK
jgi:beta-lactam-binding protein with PASTA domain